MADEHCQEARSRLLNWGGFEDMNRKYAWLVFTLVVATVTTISNTAFAKTAAELEKEKALQNPYPNDFGPATLDDSVLSSYPAEKKEGYQLLLKRCAQCHQPARPLNSRFVVPDSGVTSPAGRDAKEAAVASKMKAEHPNWFKEPGVWQIEPGIWSRYVKRMLNKPGCGKEAGGEMTPPEAKKIYEFLVYDGQRRKLGKNADAWKAHRLKLIDELKSKNPKRYEELKSQNDL
jgi:hypothetical protein